MIKPRVDKLLDHADSHYAAVVVAAKRARQINSYYHSLGEGNFGEYPPPMVDIPGDRNYLSDRARRARRRASSSTSTAPKRAPAQPEPRTAMARILLGVSGGIAAYKALELARLATAAGHGVRVLMTEGATRFVGAASFEGIVGAPVLLSEFERDPMRGAFPGDSGAVARPDRPPRARHQLRRLPDRPGLGQHDRQARRRPGRLDGHHLFPRLHRAAPARAGDERPHVCATPPRRPTWRPCASAA